MNNFSLRTYVPSDAQSVVDVINTSSTLTVGLPRAVVTLSEIYERTALFRSQVRKLLPSMNRMK